MRPFALQVTYFRAVAFASRQTAALVVLRAGAKLRGDNGGGVCVCGGGGGGVTGRGGA